MYVVFVRGDKNLRFFFFIISMSFFTSNIKTNLLNDQPMTVTPVIKATMIYIVVLCLTV